jgi:hypothetical protein
VLLIDGTPHISAQQRMQEPVRFKEEVGEAQLGECPAAAAVQVQGLVGLETWRQSGAAGCPLSQAGNRVRMWLDDVQLVGRCHDYSSSGRCSDSV